MPSLLDFQAQIQADLDRLERQRIDFQAKLDSVLAQKAALELDLSRIALALNPPPPPPVVEEAPIPQQEVVVVTPTLPPPEEEPPLFITEPSV